MNSEATQLLSLSLSAAVAVIIFIALNRDAVDRPIVWLGAVLLLVGVTGIYASWMAAQRHQNAIFTSLAHAPVNPWLAVFGYASCIAFGTILLFPFRRQK